MNQLEILSDYRKQPYRDIIVDYHAVYLGNVFVYLNKMYVAIRTNDAGDNMHFIWIKPKELVLTKDLALEEIRKNEGKSNVSIIGYEKIYLDGLSDMTPDNISIFEGLVSLFESLQYEYEEFVDYVNYNIDKLILNGGM